MDDPTGQLRENDYLRKTQGTRDCSFGRLALQIPIEDYRRLVAANPDLASRDAKVKTNAMLKFIASPESMPYRVRDKI